MKAYTKGWIRKAAAACLAVVLSLSLAACGNDKKIENLIEEQEENERIVNLFSPMEKIDPNVKNAARSAADLTIIMAEKKLGVTVEYRTYTAENYQDKTYDDVILERARNDMDDMYLFNPDTLLTLGAEGKLEDLSGLESAKNLREIIRIANTVDGKLIAIPQEVAVCEYGFIQTESFGIAGNTGRVFRVLPCIQRKWDRNANWRKPLVVRNLCVCAGICGLI